MILKAQDESDLRRRKLLAGAASPRCPHGGIVLGICWKPPRILLLCWASCMSHHPSDTVSVPTNLALPIYPAKGYNNESSGKSLWQLKVFSQVHFSQSSNSELECWLGRLIMLLISFSFRLSLLNRHCFYLGRCSEFHLVHLTHRW